MKKGELTKKLKEMLIEDLSNEYYHMLFYLRVASIVTGPFREEYKEFFLKEAQSELMHVHEFTNAIVYISESNFDIQKTIIPVIPAISDVLFDKNPSIENILLKAIAMEEEVAKKYTERLKQTESMSSAEEAWLHLFYEDQLQDSWAAAQEMKRMSGCY